MFPLSTPFKQKIREALRLALPIIAGQLGQVLMGFFDTIMIGGLGHDYIAGSGFGNNLFWMTNLLGMGILFAISTLVSEVRGEGQPWKAISVYRSGIKVAAFLSVLFTLLMLVITANLGVFGQPVRVNELAERFLHIANYSIVFIFIFMACKLLLDGLGRTKIGMVVTLGGLVLNICLNWVLIYGRLGFPRLEIEGAAIATTISRALMAGAFLIIIWRDKQIRELKKEFAEHAAEKLNYIGQILKIGIPSGLQFFFEVAAFGAAQIMSGWLGVEYEAAHLIAINMASITFMVLTGIAASGNILTGYSYGARDREGIRLAGNAVFLLTLVIEIGFALFFFTCHTLLPRMYTREAPVIAIASSMILLAGIFQISDGLQAVAAGALRGMQDVRIPSAIAFVSYWLIMVPLCYLLTFKAGLGLKGIWIGFIIGLTVAAILQIARFKWVVKSVEFKEV